MPRLTKKQKQEHEVIIDKLLNSDDDEDDDTLFKTTGLSQQSSQNSPSSPAASPQRSNSPSSATMSTSSEETQRKRTLSLEQKAHKIAQKWVDASTLNIKDIKNVDDLRWYCHKNCCLPCYILPKHDLDKVEGKGTIRYLGYMHTDKGKAFNSSEARLRPFHGDEQGDNADDSQLVWSPTMIKKFLAYIKNQRGVKDDQAFVLKVEELALQYTLDKVRSQQQEEERTTTTTTTKKNQPKLTAAEEEDSDNGYSSLPLPCPQKEDTSSAWLSPSRANRGWENNSEQCLLPRQLLDGNLPKQTLRAGDVIKYQMEALVARAENCLTATIVNVYPGRSEDIALKLDNGMHLSRDCQVRLEQRCLRNKLVPNKEACYQPVHEYRLDKSKNGEVTDTSAQALRTFVNETQEEMNQLAEKMFQQETTNASGGRKRSSDEMSVATARDMI